MADIFYHAVPTDWRREQKYRFLEDKQSIANIEWQRLAPNAKYTWLTSGLDEAFGSFLPLGSKEAKRSAKPEAIFGTFSNGIKSNSDAYVYAFSREVLEERAKRMVEMYTAELDRWRRAGAPKDLEGFLRVNERELPIRGVLSPCGIRARESCDVHERPWPAVAVQFLMCDKIADLHLCASSDAFQCFPFYTYAEDGSGRRENVTDGALAQFRQRYADPAISKWDIFHYVYAVLHHPAYRARYAANLRRELPRIPFVGGCVRQDAADSPPTTGNKTASEQPVSRVLTNAATGAAVFRPFAAAGKRLAELHVGYEQQPEFPLRRHESPSAPLNWRVEKMRLSKDKSALADNDFLTLQGIPPEAFEYRPATAARSNG